MARYIDADALKEYILRSVPNWSEDREIMLDCLSNSPTIEERKTGKWHSIGNTGLATCECGFITDRHAVYNFCPDCGSYNGGGKRWTTL